MDSTPYLIVSGRTRMTAPTSRALPPCRRFGGRTPGWRKMPLRGLKRDLFPDGARNHHQVRQPIPGPAAEPADPLLAEAGADGDRAAQAQVFRFQSHGDTFMARTASTVKFPGVRKDGCLKGMGGARAPPRSRPWGLARRDGTP